MIGIYRLKGDRVALFEDGTVLRNRRIAFNSQRLVAGGLLILDDTAAALAIKSRAAVDSHVHEAAKLRDLIRRSYGP